MFYELLPRLADVHGVFNVFVYISFRAAGAVVTSLVFAFAFGPMVIRRLHLANVGQVVRDIGPESHLVKSGTPTMGGLIIIGAATASTLLWARLDNWYTIIAVVSLLWMGSIGFLDDYLKVVQGKTRGLVARYKMIGQWTFGLGLGAVLLWQPISSHPTTWTSVPFFSDLAAAFAAPVFILFTGAVVSGTSNAVNLTDGLDGLAAGLTAICASTLGVFAYIAGRTDMSRYLGFFYLEGAGELSVFAVALAGAALGFLWFNSHPAEVFMGDTGSLALGGALGVMAILLKAEFLLVIVGGVFVLETLSVIVQRGWFKYTKHRFGEGRRVFRMAPIHHHFEKLGWSESKVVVRFWIVGVLFAMIAVSTLKIR
ncbi:MAG: phospho-N-acetylmuramoyl-pentapeptide-transferase [Gemmatimonadetes bacterium]|nr:phospho-N-acetylmuramoyl-pentapeptide-transferase [Gemmatimonadota bacterium]MDA1102817.1 phospho-N-acetylmuramoyl-pentapeptide-transferase [Gemmatimonadota bacterium]